MASTPFRYQSPDEDSARWTGFPFRDGDIVISTRSKTGTTWLQMICALLIFQELPASLAQLSPWLDHLITPRDEVYAQLAAQEHRRFIKTHTPLDGLPLDPRVSYVVTARHPLDMFVSLYRQGDNIDRARVRQLTGEPEPTGPPRPRTPLHDQLLRWTSSSLRPGSSKTTPRSSAGAPRGRAAKSSATKRPQATTRARPSSHPPTCSPGSTRQYPQS